MVKPKHYIPDSGNIVWISFNPQAGHEQAGRRPALVISPKIYNEKTYLAIFCPVTKQEKGYPFEVKIPERLKISRLILSDQIKSLDWVKREAEFACKLPKAVIKETLSKINVLLNPLG